MANVMLFRGGTPDFKPMFCKGEYAQFKPPFSSPHFYDTPPYDSHADAAQGQGYLNLVFPLVPNLQQNDAHHWQQTALKGLGKVNDVIYTNWVPLRSFVVAQHIEVVRGDPALDGVYVKPVAARVSWDFDTEDYVWETNTDYAAAVTAAGVTQLPLGTPSTGDKRWAYIDLTLPKVSVGEGNAVTVSAAAPCTFGHDLVKFDTDGKPTEGLDSYYGGVVLGLQVTAGQPAKIAEIWRSNIALYMSAKVLSFECSTQVG